jgi:HAE1 family hydrophobic/amphiphilic exporter-1
VRTTLVVSIAIPFSVIATCVFLYLTNRTLNLLTMMGLMLAVGMLVDNAIVVLESIYRHQLRGETGRDAALKGASEVGLAVTASTLTSVIVFAPIVLGGGNEIIVWLREVGITISVTLILSLLVSLTLVPMLCARLKPSNSGEPSKLIARWQARYVHWLDWCTFRRPRFTAWVLVPGFVVLTIALAAATGTKPEPDSDRGQRLNRMRVGLEFSDNVNLHRADELTHRVEDFMIAKQESLEVANVYSFYRAGEAAVTLFFDRAVPDREMRRLRKWLRENLPVVAGVTYELGEEEGGSKGAQRIEVSLFGEDSDLLHELSLEAKRRLELLPDLRDVRTNVETGQDEVQVTVQRESASRLGVRPGDVAAILNLTFRGMRVRDLQGADREMPMSILLEAEDRRDFSNLRALPVAGFEDRTVTLDQVAGFSFAKAPQEIRRNDQRTAVSVSASYEGEDLGDMNDLVARTMRGMSLPQGYSWSFGRRFQQAQQEQNDMMLNILLAIACVYFVMAALFESLLHPLVIMLCIPFALLGVIWFLALTNTPINIMAMIGLVILIGVIVNNGIVLIDHVNGMRRRGLAMREAVLQAGAERFRPILMTASTTVLGLLPLAIGDTALADAQYYPMARALIGGLIAGTVLTLLVLPTFYVLAERGVLAARGVWVRSGPRRAPLPERHPTG